MKKIKKRRKLVTQHGRQRYITRVRLTGDIDSELRHVKKNGKDYTWYTGQFYKYLMRRNPYNGRILIYDEKVYIFAVNTKKLITVYPVQEFYQPTKQYLLTQFQRSLILNAYIYMQKDVIIHCSKEKYVGKVVDIIPRREKTVYVLEDEQGIKSYFPLERITAIYCSPEKIIL